MKRYLLAILAAAFSLGLRAQTTQYPVFGAQIFVEPGQSAEEIENCFAVMEECGMKVGRVRLFGTHVQKEDGWDWSLYDRCFDAAQRHGVKLFVTLFPTTDELTDVGGFKFPSSKAHLEEVDAYTEAAVKHFRSHPAMYAWVLQNEPGLEDAVAVPMNDLTSEVYEQWAAENLVPRKPGEFLKADFAAEDFLRYFTAWYLDHIASIVEALDPVHGRHVNPHQVMKNLPQYDFAAYSGFLTSLGASLHLSWHFGLFDEEEYPFGVSLMTDIIRSSARHNPFWVTELQGGTIIWSGRAPYCPPAEHVAQYLWTCVGAGAEGVVFWTLNQRKAVSEAGEWGMLDYTGRPSDRLDAAASVAKCVEKNARLFSSLKPYESPVTILYNVQSLQFQKRYSDFWGGKDLGRYESAIMAGVSAAYEAFAAWGITPQVREMNNFYFGSASDSDSGRASGRTVVLPDMLCLPEEYVEPLKAFVAAGGRLIATGRTAYFDSDMRCIFMGGNHPLNDLFGARLKEFKVTDDYFSLSSCCSRGTSAGGFMRSLVGGWKHRGLESHLFRGIIEPGTAEPILSRSFGNGPEEVLGVRNSYGKGEVVWIPSLVELGAYHRNLMPLARLYGSECEDALTASPFCLKRPVKGVLARTMVASDGTLLVVLINKTGRKVTLRPSVKLSRKGVIYGRPSAVRRCNRVRLGADETLVVNTKLVF